MTTPKLTFGEAFDAACKHMKLARLKRWGQPNCEHCGEPLETVFNQDGKNPIRMCGRCEWEASNREYPDAQA